jgi:hypothetical protein
MEQKIQQTLEENNDIETYSVKKSTEIDVFLQESIDYTFMTSLINFEHFKYLLSKLIMSPLWVFKTPAPVISEYPGMIDVRTFSTYFLSLCRSFLCSNVYFFIDHNNLITTIIPYILSSIFPNTHIKKHPGTVDNIVYYFYCF